MSISREYAAALFLITEEDAVSEAVLAEAMDCIELFRENPDYSKILDSPALSKDERLTLIDGALGGFNEMLLNLFKIMCEKRLAHLIPSMLTEYRAIYNESRGIIDAEVVSAVSLSEAALDRIKIELEKRTDKTVRIRQTVDKTLLGGIKLRYLGIEEDASLKTRLERFEKGLKNTIL